MVLSLLPSKLADSFWLLAFSGVICTDGFLALLAVLPLHLAAAMEPESRRPSGPPSAGAQLLRAGGAGLTAADLSADAGQLLAQAGRLWWCLRGAGRSLPLSPPRFLPNRSPALATRGDPECGKPVAALVGARLFERIRRLQARFDGLCERIESGYAEVPEAEGLAEIDTAVAASRTGR